MDQAELAVHRRRQRPQHHAGHRQERIVDGQQRDAEARADQARDSGQLHGLEDEAGVESGVGGQGVEKQARAVTRAHGDERVAGDGPQPQRGRGIGEAMVGRKSDGQTLAGQGSPGQRTAGEGLLRLRADEGEVGVVGKHPVDQLQRRALMQGDRRVGAGGAGGAQDLRDHPRAQRMHEVQARGAAARVDEAGDAGGPGAQRFRRGDGGVGVHAPAGVEFEVAAAAVEQAGAQSFLQTRQSPRQRRLGDAQFCGRIPHMAGAGELDEPVQVGGQHAPHPISPAEIRTLHANGAFHAFAICAQEGQHFLHG